MVELLSPAGSPQSVEAAVQMGCDAIYLGYGDFNARRNAKNFTLEELEQAVDYCHLRGVSVFLTMNTLLSQRELEQAQHLVVQMANIGIDAVIVQDLGVADLVSQVAPSLALHASTQTTVHSLDGVKKIADFGFSRVVLARELGRSELEYIASRSPIELEVFVHGAQCMSYSGHCYLSAMVGQRSGNRGLCAQPCRLPYVQQGQKKGDLHPLSLKDMSLAGHLQELSQMGIASFKIEGRMKRPEYVAVVTHIYRTVLDEGRNPNSEEWKQLETAFSRNGFTQGYFDEWVGSHMFGMRAEGEPSEEKTLFSQMRPRYEKKEQRKVEIVADVTVEDHGLSLTFRDDLGNRVTGSCEVERAETKALTSSVVMGQLQRTGGTPFQVVEGLCQIRAEKAVPLARINSLRRELLDELADLRKAMWKREYVADFVPRKLGGSSQTAKKNLSSSESIPTSDKGSAIASTSSASLSSDSVSFDSLTSVDDVNHGTNMSASTTPHLTEIVSPTLSPKGTEKARNTRNTGKIREIRENTLQWTVSVEQSSQITSGLLEQDIALLYLPLDTPPSVVEMCQKYDVPLCVKLPSIGSDQEREGWKTQVEGMKALGVTQGLVGSLDTWQWAKDLGFSLRGDYTLNIYNNHSLFAYQGFLSLMPSFELKFPQIRDLTKETPLELMAYGHLPLMTTKNCMVSSSSVVGENQTEMKGKSQKGQKNSTKGVRNQGKPVEQGKEGKQGKESKQGKQGKQAQTQRRGRESPTCGASCQGGVKTCGKSVVLTDRKGETFFVETGLGGRSTLYNGKTLYLADKQKDFQQLGLWAGRLYFTREGPEECVDIVRAYLSKQGTPPPDLTRGLYYRGVE